MNYNSIKPLKNKHNPEDKLRERRELCSCFRRRGPHSHVTWSHAGWPPRLPACLPRPAPGGLTLALTLTLVLTLSHMLTFVLTHSCSHSLIRSCSHSHTHTPTFTHAHAHADVHSHTHTHPHPPPCPAHTGSPCRSPTPGCWAPRAQGVGEVQRGRTK